MAELHVIGPRPKPVNAHAVALLAELAKQVEAGEVHDVAVAFVAADGMPAYDFTGEADACALIVGLEQAAIELRRQMFYDEED